MFDEMSEEQMAKLKKIKEIDKKLEPIYFVYKEAFIHLEKAKCTELLAEFTRLLIMKNGEEQLITDQDTFCK